MIDTTRTVEIESSPAKLAALTLTGLGLTAGAGWLAFGLREEGILFARLLGWTGFILFGFATLLAAWRLIASRGSVIAISPQGIRDTRLAAETIPWSAITAVSTMQYRYQRTVALSVAPDAVTGLTLAFPLRWVRPINQAFGYDEFSVGSNGTKTDFTTLMAIITAYWEASQRRHGRAHRDTDVARP